MSSNLKINDISTGFVNQQLPLDNGHNSCKASNMLYQDGSGFKNLIENKDNLLLYNFDIICIEANLWNLYSGNDWCQQ